MKEGLDMRLWHERLIPYLDWNRLVDLHRTCCAMRGGGWGKKNRLIDYVYNEPSGREKLVAYHLVVLDEMKRRGFNYDHRWEIEYFCGDRNPTVYVEATQVAKAYSHVYQLNTDVNIFDKHDANFIINDALELKKRGAPIRITGKIVHSKQSVWLVYTISGKLYREAFRVYIDLEAYRDGQPNI